MIVIVISIIKKQNKTVSTNDLQYFEKQLVWFDTSL